LWEGNSTAIPNQIVAIGVDQTTPYVADCDVEIAQSSAVANPVVSALHEGTRVQIEVHPLVGSSDLLVFCQFAMGEKVAMRTVDLGPDRALPALQAPEMATTLGVMSGRVGNGGALAMQVTGSLDGRRLVLVVGAERAPVAADLQREFGMWPLSAFLSPALRHRVLRPERSEGGPQQVSSPQVVMQEERVAPVDPADAELWLQLLERALGDGDADATMLDNGCVLVRGDATARQVAARLIETYQEQFLKTVEVEIRTVADGDGSALRTARMPALLGRCQYLVHGIESTSVCDAEVEVAQKSGISDPQVGRQFSGLVADVRVYPLRGRDLGATARVDVTQTGSPTPFALGTEKGATLQQATVGRAAFAFQGALPQNGGALELGDAGELTVGRERMRSRQVLAVRSR
jgi:hypothetical protein